MTANHLGEIKNNKYGLEMKIISYKKYNDIIVEFLNCNGYQKHTSYAQFKKGTVSSPYDKTIYNVGYLGDGKHKLSSINPSFDDKIYDCWSKMIKRCYSEIKGLTTYYNQVSVCEEWHNFQNFADWYDDNYYKCSETLHLDKDIKNPLSKEYSPENCLLIQKTINVKIRSHYNGEKINGLEQVGKHTYRISFAGKRLGIFHSMKEAFDAYSDAKENLVYELAEKFKNEIPKNVYDTLKTYKCLIEHDRNYNDIKYKLDDNLLDNNVDALYLGTLYRNEHAIGDKKMNIYGRVYSSRYIAPNTDYDIPGRKSHILCISKEETVNE